MSKINDALVAAVDAEIISEDEASMIAKCVGMTLGIMLDLKPDETVKEIRDRMSDLDVPFLRKMTKK